MVTYPFITSINTEIQAAIAMKGGEMEALARDLEEYWLVVNTSIVEGTDLPNGSRMNSTSSRSSGNSGV